MFECENCDKCYTTKELLNRHIEIKHENIMKAKCDICHVEFPQKYHVIAHKEKVHMKIVSKCLICEIVFKSSVNLNRHYAHVHSENEQHEKQFKCDLCAKSFTRKQDLKRHKERIHLNIRNHVCEFCDKSFCELSELN